MRLKHIKLAGFKSFVDPTTVPFEHQMTAIVGPNGCGKSNIIDAVRWVLGESSAKNLRGDAMTDVIFNGAASRKAIGQASVELVFDNAQGRISGSMADRSQVSIRRVVNREGTNSYFLNGSKCRRRDITEIFLGTGLGPRSYAIIEQGTISRLIESRPQELRVFIEEAAGISKYKERRRETENRIKHTRENLFRLNDIRLELNGQIDKLHQQAEAAKRFRTLKAQERTYKAELAVMRWQRFETQRQEHQGQVLALENKIAKQNALQSSNELQLIFLKESILASNDKNQHLQQAKLTVTQNIARAEQNIKYLKEQANKTRQDESLIQQQLINAQELVLREQKQLHLCRTHLTEKEPKLQLLESKLLDSQNNLAMLQQEQTELQKENNKQQQTIQNNQAKMLALRGDITQQQTILEQQQQQLKQVMTQLDDLPTAESLAFKELQQEQVKIEITIQAIQVKLEQWRFKQQQYEQNVLSITKESAFIAAQIDNKKEYIEQLSRQLGQKSENTQTQLNWLEHQHIQSHGLLKDILQVENGWEKAADTVLSYWLMANIVDDFPSIDIEKELTIDSLVLHIQPVEVEDAKAGTLASKLSGFTAINSWLNSVYIADDYASAVKQLKTRSKNESIICRDGTWLSHNMLRKGQVEAQSNLLQLEQQFLLAKEQLNILVEKSQSISLQQASQQDELALSKQQFNSAQNTLEDEQGKSNELAKQQQVAEQKAQFITQQKLALTRQKQTFEKEIQQARSALEQLESQQLVQPQHALEQHEHIIQKQLAVAEQIQVQQKQSDNLHQQRHQLALEVEQLKSQRSQFEQTIFSHQENINTLTKRQAENTESANENQEPLEGFERNLPQWLNELSQLNQQLDENQSLLNDNQTLLNEIELSQKSAQQKVSMLTSQLSQFHLDSESFKLRAETALEVLKELNQDAKTILKEMPNNAKESIWQAHISKIARDIQLLGAINLAAIEEYETQFERKVYLDQQDQDLNKAIVTLEAAIAKIDKETKQKFKSTFEQVNNDLKRLFPKVFGGGEAYLTLTEDDLLEAGVTIMARPPGKKNSTIHLLSGGEKALTALSLVFAIFRLNPAPFCLLDEVDAPLDDANVSRFCNLVQEMSQTVQFIYISHNKIAMEMASHLTGVTMFEPGVSRMVAVDIDEAIAMAEV